MLTLLKVGLSADGLSRVHDVFMSLSTNHTEHTFINLYIVNYSATLTHAMDYTLLSVVIWIRFRTQEAQMSDKHEMRI